jgi:2-deoxy-D-gluconate 3-dehydrogenase
MEVPSFRLDGRIAMVTGSGSGMGRAFSIALAKAGADVVITELPGKEKAAEDTAAEVRAAGRRALTLPLDVRQVASIHQMVERTLGEWGQIDILVNNAGMNIRKMAVDVGEEDWDQVLDTDLKGVFFCAQAVGRHMIRRGQGGKIINIASQVGLVAYHSRVAYCAAKAGVINMTRALALEWAPHHINVNAIAPTFVRTPLVEELLKDPAVRDDVLRHIPLGRLAEPEDIVGAVVYLAGPASDLVTGHTLVVDGGWTAV